MNPSAPDALRWSLAADRDEIREVIYRYCRGIDRLQLELVRSCYHPDGTDDHGDYRGGVDGFIDHVASVLPTWEHTSHFLGNLLIELDGDRARAETYGVAYHRRAARGDRPALDFVAGIRYVDDFERRDGEWRIAARVCLVDWTRTDDVGSRGWVRPEHYTQPHRGSDDPVFSDRLPVRRGGTGAA